MDFFEELGVKAKVILDLKTGEVTSVKIDPEHIPTVKRLLIRRFENFSLPIEELEIEQPKPRMLDMSPTFSIPTSNLRRPRFMWLRRMIHRVKYNCVQIVKKILFIK
jgi:sporulation protein YlmC with PRC-barrel domain